jgi:hypothetical protein
MKHMVGKMLDFLWRVVGLNNISTFLTPLRYQIDLPPLPKILSKYPVKHGIELGSIWEKYPLG